MLTEKDFIHLYRTYSNEQLLEIHQDIEGYSAEAKSALHKIIQEKGGEEVLLKNQQEQSDIQKERVRIFNEAQKLSGRDTNADFLKSMIHSDILPSQEVHKILEDTFNTFSKEQEKKTIQSKTIVMAIIGMLISSIIGGILWALLLDNSNRVPIFLIILIIAICYFIILFITKKAKDSALVIISSIIAFVLAFFIGAILLRFM